MTEEKMTYVILVDKKDKEIGREEKLKAHQEGKLHRAFSVFIFNKKGELLLQKRAESKYHSGGLWSNACCSHPRPGFGIKEEAKKRLKEEMGIKVDLKETFSFIYKAKVGDLIEHEFDYVFVGKFDGEPKPNKSEVEDWKWLNEKDLRKDIKENPERYTLWLKIILNKVFKWKNLK
ncbi:isopentenyl-diphosphate Delta-isomerase [Patescibacteria group bacterium]|nr:isopentenyl-diphosphate Delta-isomerase [Patescibacteria group bacterium]MBU4480896.1 isopentenyl-diphosphate Delta-isomerase [Patescibacteria group bacterium]